MTQCPTCNVWLPAHHAHSKAECDEHVSQGRAIKAGDDVWGRRYAVQRVVQMRLEEVGR